MDNREYGAIVVGAGMAGLTSTAYLLKQGISTLVCEMADKPGGLVGSFRQNGYTFDSGIRAFENSGIIFPMLKDLGIEIEFKRNPVSIGIEDKVVRLSSRDSLAAYQDFLCGFFPKNTEEIAGIACEIKKVMQYMDVLYGIDNPLFIDYTKDKEYLTKTLLPWLIKYQINIRKAAKLKAPINTHLGEFTAEQSLIDMIAQHFFKNTPAFFALSYFGLYLDYSYPSGGTGVLVDKMTEWILGRGGTIMTGTKITRVDPAKKQICTADGQCFGYQKLIWTADSKSLYRAAELGNISQRKHRIKAVAQKALAEQTPGCDSILTLYLGVSRDKSDFELICGAHTFYTPRKVGLSSLNAYDDILAKQLPVDEEKEAIKDWLTQYLKLTTYEISFPSLRDASLAPQGKTGMIVSTLMDYSLTKHVQDAGWYEEFKAFCTEVIVKELGASLFGGLEAQIDTSVCSTPVSIEKLTGNAQGAITGWAFLKRIPAENRFRKIKNAVNTPIPNVYQAGQWSFSPAGLPVSILTGKLAADEAARRLARKSWRA